MIGDSGNQQPLTKAALDRFVWFAAVTAFAGYVLVYALGLTWPPIRSDGVGYYMYLPAWFIHHDPTLERTAAECCGGEFPAFTNIWRWPTTGRWVNAHPMGEALLLIPFFLVADAMTWWSTQSRDGSSLYYQLAAGVAGVFYFAAGLVFLRRILTARFSAGVVLATLISIVWGTNLYHYATYDSIFSHVFSFFLLAALLDTWPRWLARPSYRHAVALALLVAFIVLVRHMNALLLLFIALYGVVDSGTARERLDLLWARRRELLVMALSILVLLVPQIILYRYATNRWLFNPYMPNAWFDFAPWNIPRVLFSTQKGLFFWSPILLLAVAGIPSMRRRCPELWLPTLVVLPATVLLIGSWSDWQLGGGYGHRGFTELMPVFAIAMASFFSGVRTRALRLAVGGFAGVAVVLSIVQMLQYWMRIIPFSDTSWELYRSIFLKFSR